MDVLKWQCEHNHGYYTIICQCGVQTVAEPISVSLWARTIDRAWLLRRVVKRLEKILHEQQDEKTNKEIPA